MNRGLTILIVDNDVNFIDVLKIALQRNGINNPVQAVRDGQEALDYLCGRGSYRDRGAYPFPSVIFIELHLPRIDGFELLQWLKDNPQCAIVPAIILSVSDLDSDIRKAYLMGANSYIVKPETLPELQKAIRVTYEYWHLCSKPTMPENC